MQPRLIVLALSLLLFPACQQSVLSQCKHEGLSLEDTQSYIENVASTSIISVLEMQRGKLTFDISADKAIDVDFMNVDCGAIEADLNKNHDYYLAWLECQRGTKCIAEQGKWKEGEVTHYADPDESGRKREWGFLTTSRDADTTGNLARALQHFNFLLQEEFHKAHPTQSDPFSQKH